MFSRSEAKELKFVEGGRHWLNLSNAKEVNEARINVSARRSNS